MVRWADASLISCLLMHNITWKIQAWHKNKMRSCLWNKGPGLKKKKFYVVSSLSKSHYLWIIPEVCTLLLFLLFLFLLLFVPLLFLSKSKWTNGFQFNKSAHPYFSKEIHFKDLCNAINWFRNSFQTCNQI
jgi:hypothetical protein